MTAPFTLAHLSDVHLAPVPWPRLTELDAKRALGLANWHRKRRLVHGREVADALAADMLAQYPDHIAVGGDLVNIGLPGEIEAAAAWLRALGPPEAVSVVPGNHDVYGSFGSDPGIARWNAYMGGTGAFPFVRRFGRVALIGLNSAVPTPVFYASGRLGQAQIDALAALLASLGAENACRIVMIHHPPLPGQASWRRGLDDAADLAAILAQHGAELVLHGHNHQASLVWSPGPAARIPVVGVPSASVRPGFHDPAARYNLFAIEPVDKGWRIALTGRQLQLTGQFATVGQVKLSS
jgi:3',5'-cyclic AMP phosphodiesterase CpdA